MHGVGGERPRTCEERKSTSGRRSLRRSRVPKGVPALGKGRASEEGTPEQDGGGGRAGGRGGIGSPFRAWAPMTVKLTGSNLT